MEYIEKYLGEGQIIAGLKSSQGMYYLSQLLSQSSFYAERKQVGKWQEQKSFKENEKEAKQELLESIPEEIQKKLENISKKDKHFLYELYYGAASYAPALQNDEDTETETEQQHNQHLKQNIQYLEKYVKALEVGNPREEQYRTNFVYGNLNYNYITAILEKDFETTGFAYQTFSSETVKTISYHNRERNNELPISDKVSQNILYRLATEFYGYTGRNDAMELMQYFSEGEGHIHGLYYKDGRYINNDRAVDQKFDLTYLEDKNLSNKEVSLQVEKIVKTILYAPIQNAQTGQIV
ncbi:MAG: hypothetical protein LBD11_07850 [Candidatus Peribacteria bacterium]|jgi:DNA-directed RNA polymerase beta subunit|nr:hypothetical protein [Candidatus Peribacteria bacterium]